MRWYGNVSGSCTFDSSGCQVKPRASLPTKYIHPHGMTHDEAACQKARIKQHGGQPAILYDCAFTVAKCTYNTYLMYRLLSYGQSTSPPTSAQCWARRPIVSCHDEDNEGQLGNTASLASLAMMYCMLLVLHLHSSSSAHAADRLC